MSWSKAFVNALLLVVFGGGGLFLLVGSVVVAYQFGILGMVVWLAVVLTVTLTLCFHYDEGEY